MKIDVFNSNGLLTGLGLSIRSKVIALIVIIADTLDQQTL
jgi:hypothetical protein